MSNLDKVLEVMRTDPDAEWTAPQIAQMIFGDRCGQSEKGKIASVLMKATKYQLVEHIGVMHAEYNHKSTYLWRLTQ